MQDNQSQTHWAYIAGVMDSDGCFMISSHKRKTKNGTSKRSIAFPKTVEHWNVTFLPCVKIAMIEPEAVTFIRDDMGYGTMYLYGARPSRPGRKPIYDWSIKDKVKIIPFLEGVLPYLRVKKNRAEHLMMFCKHLRDFGNQCYRGLPKDELDYREDMYWKMRKLNGSKVGAETKPHWCESTSDSPTL